MNVADHVARIAARRPSDIALRFEGTSLTYGTLDTCANMLADTLAQRGIRVGDRVALHLPNIPAFALAYLAVLRTGAIAVSINAIFKSDEVKYIINDAGARMIFTSADIAANIPRGECPSVDHIVCCEGRVDGLPSLDAWLAAGSATFQSADLAPDEPAAILYSSGTTGFPKGVTLSHANIVSNIRTAAKYSAFKRGSKLACFLPLFHVFAQNYIMNGAFEAGATVVLIRRFVPDAVLDAIEHERITHFFGVPTIFIAMLSLETANRDLGSIHYDFSAAATLPQEVARRWTERYGRAIHEGYGLTECAPFAAYNHLKQHKFGSVGTAVEAFAITILDADDKPVATGTWGEICIKGPGVMLGYWGRPEDSERALRGGWLHSGDIGRIDDEGYVFIVDRVKDMINVAGFKVWPAEVENMLYGHPAVRELAVYGVPHPEKGEAVRVAIVLKAEHAQSSDATPAAFIAYCREKLAAYKAPERVDIVVELPKNATGKILKRVLREQAARSAGGGE